VRKGVEKFKKSGDKGDMSFEK